MIAGLEQAGLTPSDIARLARISRQTIYRIKNGEAREPSHQMFTKLALLSQRHGVPVPPPSHRR